MTKISGRGLVAHLALVTQAHETAHKARHEAVAALITEAMERHPSQPPEEPGAAEGPGDES